MSEARRFIWPLGPVANDEPTRWVVNATDYDALREDVARLREALERIAKYGDNGICPYGCDTPHIAKAALTQGKG